MRALLLGLILGVGLLVSTAGCISVKAPDKIEIGGGDGEPVDSRNTPQTSSQEDCQRELDKAYREIRKLQAQVKELREEKKDCERERDNYKKRLKRYEVD